MMTYPFVMSIKLFDYRIKLWQPRTVVARANVSSSDRSELLLSLRVRYICWQRWVGFIRCQFEHAFPPTGFLWLGSAVRYTIYSHDGSSWSYDTNFHSSFLTMLQIKFGFDWPSGFREDVWNCGRRTDAGAWVYCNFGSGELQSISQRHDESGDANMRKLDLSMKYFRSRDQIVLMRKSKIHIKQILSDWSLFLTSEHKCSKWSCPEKRKLYQWIYQCFFLIYIIIINLEAIN